MYSVSPNTMRFSRFCVGPSLREILPMKELISEARFESRFSAVKPSYVSTPGRRFSKICWRIEGSRGLHCVSLMMGPVMIFMSCSFTSVALFGCKAGRLSFDGIAERGLGIYSSKGLESKPWFALQKIFGGV